MTDYSRRAEGRVGARAGRDRRARGARAHRRASPTGSTTPSSATSCRRAATRSTARGTSRSRPGVPIEVPALTVNRLCGSGIQAAVSGAQLIQLGEADIVLTGGIESMSQAPHVIRGLRSGLRLEPGQARGLALRSAARSVLRPVHGADGGEVRREVRHLARRAGSPTRCAASRRRRRPGPRAGSRTRSCPSRSSRARA